MRHLCGILIVGGLLLGATSAARAQVWLNGWATTPYPGGFPTVSPYGSNGIGYRGQYSGSVPLNSYSPSFLPGTRYYSSTYVAPRAGSYSYLPSMPYPSWPGYTTRYPSYYGNSYAPGTTTYSYTPRPWLPGGPLLRRSW
jgi:hypothetical protein